MKYPTNFKNRIKELARTTKDSASKVYEKVSLEFPNVICPFEAFQGIFSSYRNGDESMHGTAEREERVNWSPCITRQFDVTHYNKTGEIRYLDEMEGQELSTYKEKVEQGKINAGKMRTELDTLAKMQEAIIKHGNPQQMAKHYGVSDHTVYAWLKTLKKQSNELVSDPDPAVESEIAAVITHGPAEIAQPTREEVEQFFAHPDPLLPTISGTMNQEYVDNKFAHILAPVAELLQAKNTDYGHSYDQLRQEFGTVAFLVRISDKFNRLKTLAKQPALVKSESIKDTIRDMIGYCTLELNFLEEQEAANENH